MVMPASGLSLYSNTNLKPRHDARDSNRLSQLGADNLVDPVRPLRRVERLVGQSRHAKTVAIPIHSQSSLNLFYFCGSG
jgi:hypothetical protein